MEKILEQGLLFDFYGELLTEHQKKIYGEAVDNDMSLGEIADEYGITRQGVHDLLKRSNHILEEYEEKLQLVRKFTEIREKVSQIHQLTNQQDLDREELARQLRQLSDEILEEL